MTSVLVALVIGLAVVVAALIVRKRRDPAAPTQPSMQVPAQVDRADFAQPDAPWLVAVFTSTTCNVCADVARKAEVVACADVAVQEVEFTAHRDLHRRYAIDAVPAVIIADDRGVVRRSFLGPVTATDLWAGVAEARQPSVLGDGEG